MTAVSSNNSSALYSLFAQRELGLSIAEADSGRAASVKAGADVGAVTLASNLNTSAVSLSQALKNHASASSFSQAADQGLSRIRSKLDEIRDVVESAASDPLSSQDRKALGLTLDNLVQDIENITDTTEYGGRKLLNGSFSSADGGLDASFQLGENASDQTSISVADVSPDALFGGMPLNVSTSAAATVSLGMVDDAIEMVDTARGRISGASAALSASETQIANSLATNKGESTTLRVAVATESTTNALAAVIQQGRESVAAQLTNLSPQLLELVKPVQMPQAEPKAVEPIKAPERQIPSLLEIYTRFPQAANTQELDSAEAASAKSQELKAESASAPSPLSKYLEQQKYSLKGAFGSGASNSNNASSNNSSETSEAA